MCVIWKAKIYCYMQEEKINWTHYSQASRIYKQCPEWHKKKDIYAMVS